MSLNIYLHRWAPSAAHASLYGAMAASLRPHLEFVHGDRGPLAGYSRTWISRSLTDGGRFATNGLFTVIFDAETRDQCSTLDEARRIVEQPGLIHGREGDPEAPISPIQPQLLFQGIPESKSLDYLSTFTTAFLLLDELAKPDPFESGYRSYARLWLGRFQEVWNLIRGDAQRDRRFMRVYVASTPRERKRLRAYWRTVDADAASASAEHHPLAELLRPLQNLSLERDEAEVLEELRGRVAGVAAGVGAVSAAFGALLANAIFAGAQWALLAIGTPLMLYLLAVSLFWLLDIAREHWLQAAFRELPTSVSNNSLTNALANAAASPTTVHIGARTGAVDFACGVTLWVALLEQNRDTVLTVDDAPSEARVNIVIGGPLVRSWNGSEPLCDLRPTDALYRRWGYVADGRLVTEAEHDGSLGVISCATSDDDTLFLSGFRDARAGTAWILRHLHGGADATNGQEPLPAWKMVRIPFAALRG